MQKLMKLIEMMMMRKNRKRSGRDLVKKKRKNFVVKIKRDQQPSRIIGSKNCAINCMIFVKMMKKFPLVKMTDAKIYTILRSIWKSNQKIQVVYLIQHHSLSTNLPILLQGKTVSISKYQVAVHKEQHVVSVQNT